MQRTLLALALLAASASGAHVWPAVFGGWSYVSQWCGPNGGLVGNMVETEAECRHAGRMLGKPWAGVAGKEWYAGCIVNNGGVYFVPYDTEFETTGNHRDAPVSGDHGFICQNDDADDLGAFDMPGTSCREGHRIQTEQECANAARSMSFEGMGLAGQEWEDGCIINHGVAYWVPLATDGIDVRTSHHNGGSLCRMQRAQRPAPGFPDDDDSDEVPDHIDTELPVTPVVTDAPATDAPVVATATPATPVPATPEPTSKFHECHVKEYVYDGGAKWSKKLCKDFAIKMIFSNDNHNQIIRKKKNFCKSHSKFFKKCARNCCYFKVNGYTHEQVWPTLDNKAN